MLWEEYQGQSDRQERKKLQEAIAAYENGIRLFQPQGNRAPNNDLADLLVSCSAAYLQLGNLGANSGYAAATETQVPAFHKARENAERAAGIHDRKCPEYALTALGNAQEDIAYFLLRDKRKEAAKVYEEAVASFTAATTDKPDYAKSWMDLGRCLYRWVNFADGPESLLDRALTAVKEAQRLDPNSRDAAEAADWEGLIHWHRGRFALADEAFQRAMGLADKFDLRQWRLYAKNRIDCAAFEIAGNPKAAKAARERCRAAAEAIFKKNEKDIYAATVLGDSYRQGNPADYDLVAAVQAYDKALPVLPAQLKQVTVAHLPLLIRRVECVRADPKRFKRNVKDLIATADRAVELAPDQDLNLKAQALGAAGTVRCLAIVEQTLEDRAQVAKYREAAVQQLRQAVGLDPSYHDAVLWRVSLARELQFFGTAKEAAKLEQEARKLLTEARAREKSRTFRDEIDRMLEKWKWRGS
jgi:tetratricopeptide (TPR) repeat protein